MTLPLACETSCPAGELETPPLAANDTKTSVRGQLIGPANAPAVLVLGGISAGRALVDLPGQAGWWPEQAGAGKPLDPARLRLLSADFPDTGSGGYPTTHDQARAFLALADRAGIDRFSVVGSSYGGMIALTLAELAPHRIERALVISAAHRSSAMAQAWRSIQRDTVELALRLGDGAAGLDLARRLAMTTYRTPEELEGRFYEPDPDSRDAGGICTYLEARGADYAERVDPHRFLALSRSMDAHEARVEKIQCPVTYLAVVEDRLVPVEQIAEAAGRTPHGTLKLIHSVYGHDAFLKEETLIAEALNDFTGALT